MFINEVLSLIAQELDANSLYPSVALVLNEVLSLNAQESRQQTVEDFLDLAGSSMKS